jgi:hypothetical protein
MWLSIRVPAETQSELQASLDFLTAISAGQIKRHGLPHPYRAGIRYQREPEGREDWQTALETLERKTGDCEDLAAYLAGYLQAHGHPHARAFLRPSRGVGYHCLVQDGAQILDPSRVLGMGKEALV